MLTDAAYQVLCIRQRASLSNGAIVPGAGEAGAEWSPTVRMSASRQARRRAFRQAGLWRSPAKESRGGYQWIGSWCTAKINPPRQTNIKVIMERGGPKRGKVLLGGSRFSRHFWGRRAPGIVRSRSRGRRERGDEAHVQSGIRTCLPAKEYRTFESRLAVLFRRYPPLLRHRWIQVIVADGGPGPYFSACRLLHRQPVSTIRGLISWFRAPPSKTAPSGLAIDSRTFRRTRLSTKPTHSCSPSLSTRNKAARPATATFNYGMPRM